MRSPLRLSLVAAVTLVALALTAGGMSATSEGTATGAAGASTKLLRVATTAGVTTWDPIKSFSTEVAYMANIYEPLLYSNPPGSRSRFRPALATSWTKSADGKTWTFKLRRGVRFTNGEPLNAAAVKMSIEAAAARGGASFIWAPLDTITTPDQHTVVIKLKYSAPVGLIASAEYGAWIVCPEALKAAAANSNYFESGRACGTGPYTLSSYKAGKQVVLSRNKGYWNGWKGKRFEAVVLQITPEAIVQQQMLQSGQVDLASSIPLENVKRFSSDRKYNVVVRGTSQNYLGFFNVKRPPLDRAIVRRALSYAIPYKDIVAVGANGYGSQARGPVPFGIFPWSPKTPQYQYDLKKARALLAEAGHKGGGFSLTLTYAAENQSEARFAPLIKDSFAKIGVKVTLKPMLFNQQWALAKGDPAQAQDIFVVMYWPTYSDAGADNLWSLFRSSKKPFFNLSYWKSDKYDRLVDGAGEKTATNTKAAQADYLAAMKLLYADAPGFFLYDAKTVLITPRSIRTAGAYNINYPFVTFFYPMQAA